MIGSFIGVAAGAITPFQTALFDGQMVWLSSAMKTLGTPTVGLSALIVGTTLGQTVYRLWVSFRKGKEGGRFGLLQVDLAVEKGADDGGALGGAPVNVLDNDHLIEEKFGFGEFGDDAAATDGGPRNDGGIISIEDEGEEPDELPLPSITVILALVVTKMVLCPMAGIAMIYFLADVVIRDADVLDTQLIKLVLILEAAVPSADFVIVTCALSAWPPESARFFFDLVFPLVAFFLVFVTIWSINYRPHNVSSSTLLLMLSMCACACAHPIYT
jgi:hypothetical protein